ncbi:MAG: acyl-CoA carboxylase subunit beta [Dehalococcoidia bacterium]
MTEVNTSSRLEQERQFSLKTGNPDRRARERVESLLDPGSFLEVGLLARDVSHNRGDKSPSDAMIAGYGTISGHRVGILSLDGAVLAGSGGKAAGAKEDRIIDEAYRCGFPVISLGEGGGGRIPDMMGSTLGTSGAIGKTGLLTRLASRQRPFQLIACCMGEMYGAPSFKVGLADWPLMVRGASLGISGPPVLRAALGEEVTGEELGGSAVHEANGQVARVEATEEDLFDTIRAILDFTLVPHKPTTDPTDRPTPELETLIPAAANRAYDMRRVVKTLLDSDCPPLYFWEGYGQSAIGCLGRLGGRAVGVFASQPLVRGGVLDVESSRKGTMFTARCQRAGIPIIYLHDVPGFLVGRHAEREGILGAAMAYLEEMASATVPKISLVLRKSYGMAYFAMGGQFAASNYIAALPSARIAFMGPEPGINLVYAKKLAQLDVEARDAQVATLMAEWGERAEPWEAAFDASIDDVIFPSEARRTLCAALAALAT